MKEHPDLIAAERELGRRLDDFLELAWEIVEPEAPFQNGWHIGAMCEHLAAVTSGQIQNLIITIPPGCTKSITTSVVWPAWVWSQRPAIRWLCGSNVYDLAIRDAVSSRRLIESEWYQARWPKVRLTSDQNVKSWYENTSRGFRTSVATGTTVTGRKGDILLLDDPNDALKVESEAERKAVNDWWDKAFYNRVNSHKTSSRVVIGQRLHHGDLIGHILKTSDKFVELRIPEQYNPRRSISTPLFRDPRAVEGELLRPERFGTTEVEDAKKRLGEMGYAAQHQQEPEAVEGGRFKQSWFKYYSRRGDILQVGERYVDLRELGKFQTVDPAASEKTTADWTVISTWSWFEGNLLWLGCLRVQREIPDIVPLIQQQVQLWRPNVVAIEAEMANTAVYQIACRVSDPIIPAVPVNTERRDKLVRATPAMVLASTGRLWLPGDDSTFPRAEVEHELTRFTGTDRDDHDDIVDTLSYAVELESLSTHNQAAPSA